MHFLDQFGSPINSFKGDVIFALGIDRHDPFAVNDHLIGKPGLALHDCVIPFNFHRERCDNPMAITDGDTQPVRLTLDGQAKEGQRTRVNEGALPSLVTQVEGIGQQTGVVAFLARDLHPSVHRRSKSPLPDVANPGCCHKAQAPSVREHRPGRTIAPGVPSSLVPASSSHHKRR